MADDLHIVVNYDSRKMSIAREGETRYLNAIEYDRASGLTLTAINTPMVFTKLIYTGEIARVGEILEYFRRAGQL